MSTSIIFPGQATQYFKMGYKLLKEELDFKKYYSIANDILHKDIYYEIFENTREFMKEPNDIQPAIFITSYIAYQYLKKRYEVQPLYLAGHSLGEVTALVCSDMLTFEEGVKLVSKRSTYMVEAVQNNKGIMLSIMNISPSCVQAYLEREKDIYLACYNSHSQLVIGGNEEAVLKAEVYFSRLGGKVKRLNTIGAFHTPLMQEASERLENYLKQVDLKKSYVPVISNVTARPYPTIDETKELLAKQLIYPVQWERTIQFLEQSFVKNLVEVLPSMTLAKLSKYRNNKFIAMSMEENEYAEALEKKSISGKTRRLTNICQCYASGCKNKNSMLEVNSVCEAYERLSNYSFMSETMYEKKEIKEVLELLKIILIQKGYQNEEITTLQVKALNEIGVFKTSDYIEGE